MLKTPSFRRYRKHPVAVGVRFLKHENMGNSDRVKIKREKIIAAIHTRRL
jgi:hypothetical protein